MMAERPFPRQRRSRKALAAVAHEDPAAFCELFEQFRDVLRAEARQHVRPGADASIGESDLVQDTYLAACQHGRDFRGTTDQELAAWLLMILRHTAINRARAAPPVDPTPVAPGEADRPDSGQVPPDEALAAKEQAAVVREVMSDLRPDYRAGLHLRFGDRLSFGEIGRRLGRSADAGRMLLVRAVDAFRRRVGAAGAEDG